MICFHDSTDSVRGSFSRSLISCNCYTASCTQSVESFAFCSSALDANRGVKYDGIRNHLLSACFKSPFIA